MRVEDQPPAVEAVVEQRERDQEEREGRVNDGRTGKARTP